MTFIIVIQTTFVPLRYYFRICVSSLSHTASAVFESAMDPDRSHWHESQTARKHAILPVSLQRAPQFGPRVSPFHAVYMLRLTFEMHYKLSNPTPRDCQIRTGC